jgi:uncharacterized protein YbaP (TraB family)
MRRLPLVLALIISLAACKPQSREMVTPALWEVAGDHGERAWLFGTIHALPAPVTWRSAAVEAALAGSDRLVLEIADIDDQQALSRIFARLAASPDQPPLDTRVSSDIRPRLLALLREFKLDPAQFGETETWAAALTIANVAQAEAKADFGLDREILSASQGKPIGELEGAAAQLGLFDALPEAEQRDLLAAIVVEAAQDTSEDRLGNAWRKGDLAVMEAEAHSGMMADPELHQMLLTNRNKDWANRLTIMLQQGARPLVAVGALHLVGAEGLPALLAARGYKVRRLQ